VKEDPPGWRPATKTKSSGWRHFCYWKSKFHGIKIPQQYIDEEPNPNTKEGLIKHNASLLHS
jgi:hypothetical protein